MELLTTVERSLLQTPLDLLGLKATHSWEPLNLVYYIRLVILQTK